MFASLVDTLPAALRRRSVLTGPARNTRPGIDFVDLGPAVVRYRMEGAGPRTILFAADPPVTLELYDELLARLSTQFRVVVFEVPGFGFSLPKLGFDFRFDAATELCGRFIEKLDLGPCALAFPCVAAYTAIRLAHLRPDLISELIVIQAPSWREELRWKAGRDPRGLLGLPGVGQLILQLAGRRRAPQWFKAALARPDLLESFNQEVDWAFRNGACFCLASAFQQFLTDEEPDLDPVSQPSLIVWGESDRTHAKTDKTSAHIYCPHALELRIPDAGHFPELEAPKAFADRVVTFLKR